MIVKLLVLVICVHNVICLFILLIKRQLVASETEQNINSTIIRISITGESTGFVVVVVTVITHKSK